MGISAKHAYRFVYLRSDKWKDVRFEALANVNSACKICGVEDFHNDAHHVFYPENIWGTVSEDLVILCRPCHQMVQGLFFQQSTRQAGKKSFDQIVDIIREWINSKKEWLGIKISIKKKALAHQCEVCRTPHEEKINSVNIFRLLKTPSEYSFPVRICDECKRKAASEISIACHDPNLGKRKGFAYRTVRLWLEHASNK